VTLIENNTLDGVTWVHSYIAPEMLCALLFEDVALLSRYTQFLQYAGTGVCTLTSVGQGHVVQFNPVVSSLVWL
jgi:hypothetical protein